LTQDVAQAALDYAFPSPNGSPPADVTRWNNPTNMYRSLAALSASNRSHIAMAHLKERFSQYLAGSPANPTPPQLQGDVGGPLPEYWVSRTDLNLTQGQLNPAQPVDGSGSHGWCGVALLWLHEYVLGVTVTAPGGTSLRIAPDLIGLQVRFKSVIFPEVNRTECRIFWFAVHGRCDKRSDWQSWCVPVGGFGPAAVGHSRWRVHGAGKPCFKSNRGVYSPTTLTGTTFERWHPIRLLHPLHVPR
jgi:hypothetical protein